ncbi:GNAT family N-acetyltransferase [Roseibium litorale]|uniref:GNAT family N-acetyltransferase n=1 Tax=Roseibium litorale TaxID=2803841 RepID=A0ABR9CV26_9HYPH|nr:GNAT family N-acetyltransferase [Roseibium litorale]MBD8894057.1 GNAT family N-acetyltransferase [Roseibium litorale]
MPLDVRRAIAEDAEQVANLLRRSIIELCTPDHLGDPERYERWIANKTPENALKWIEGPGAVFVAVTECRVSGVGMGSPDGEVLLNYVLPDARFSGVSKALMEAVEAYFVDAGLKTSKLKSSGTAERFYRSLGYAETGEVEVHRGMTFRSFRKSLI